MSVLSVGQSSMVHPLVAKNIGNIGGGLKKSTKVQAGMHGSAYRDSAGISVSDV